MGRPFEHTLTDRPVAAPAGPAPVAAEIARLDTLDLGDLRVQFRNRTGRIAPAHLSRSLLLRVLAYRIQAQSFGDLRPDTRRMLDRIAAPAKPDATVAKTAGRPEPVRQADRPRVGTMLVREWQGRMQHVIVLDGGFAWNGTPYPSLSAAAFAITGTRWNGRRFFGVGEHRPGAAP